MGYRNIVRIIGEVLQITQDNNGINHTAMLRKANLSHSMLCKIVTNLLQAGLVDQKLCDGQRIYAITASGRDYLNKYKQFAEMTSTFGLRL